MTKEQENALKAPNEMSYKEILQNVCTLCQFGLDCPFKHRNDACSVITNIFNIMAELAQKNNVDALLELFKVINGDLSIYCDVDDNYYALVYNLEYMDEITEEQYDTFKTLGIEEITEDRLWWHEKKH